MKRFVMMMILIPLLLPALAMAKFNKNQKVILLEEAKEGENLGSIEKLLDSEELSKKVHLIGQAKMTKIEKSNQTIVQLVWTGIKDPKDGNRQVAFEQPMMSTFKVKNLSKTKGISLPIEGEPETLLTAIEKLETDPIDKEDIQKKRKGKNPKKKGRFVEGEIKNNKSNVNAQADKIPPPDLANTIQNDSHNKPSPQNGTSLQTSQPSSKTRSSALGNAHGSEGLRGTGNESVLTGMSQSSNRNRENNQPIALSNAVPLGQNTNNEERLNVQDLEQAEGSEEQEGNETPLITFEPTEAGCQPRIDRVHERVIIQNRIRRLENNMVVNEGECTDSLEIYPIMKDYLGVNCTDIVNMDEQRAFSRYQEYWYDRDNQRHNIEDTLYTDTRRPYHFMDEIGLCAPLIDLEASLAYRQVETVYFNFNNIRKVVQGCHRAPNKAPIPIVQTTERCGLIHDFENNISYEQKRSIFNIDGVEHEAQACHQVDPSLPHEFVEMGCRPIVDLVGGAVTKTARRRIRTSTGLKVITDDCEPWENNNLVATREGCEGEYFHDFNLMRSYLKKRYYFARENNNRDYVTGCVRTNEFLQQQTEHDGTYEHDDAARVSKPRLSLYLDTEEQGRVFLDVARVRGQLGQVAYTLLKNEHRPTNSFYFEGCYRRTRTSSVNVYNRVDKTPYELVLGAGDIINGTNNECTTVPEERNSSTVLRKGKMWRHTTYKKEYRTKTTYPDGNIVYSPWHF